jgi:hypothetical protein
VVVKYEPIDGDPSIAPVEVAATYAVNGEILVITLGEDLRANMVYRVKLNAGILDTSDNGLVEEVEWYFASNITPHYTTVELVRLDIGPFITQFTNWDVEKIIHDVSQWADFIAEDEVSEDNITYYRCFTRYETDNRLLQRAMMDMATRQGEDVRLGDFSVKMDGSLVPDINQATKWVRENLAECERFLRGEKGKARPIFAVKGEAKYPYPFTQRRF